MIHVVFKVETEKGCCEKGFTATRDEPETEREFLKWLDSINDAIRETAHWIKQ